ncbi:unnamed protein product, partial [Cuscuta europaea]
MNNFILPQITYTNIQISTLQYISWHGIKRRRIHNIDGSDRFKIQFDSDQLTWERDPKSTLLAAAFAGMEFEVLKHEDEVVAERWSRHRKDPWWVVGEQRQRCPPFGEFAGISSPLGLLGDMMEESIVAGVVLAMISSLYSVLRI